MTTIPSTPYSHHLDGRDPLVVMREMIKAYRNLPGGWTDAQWEMPTGPGKWTVRQVTIHLAQTELALGTRARMALTTESFQAQSFDQDRWLARELGISGPDALNVFIVLASMNLALYESLTDADREITLNHNEHGPMTVNWVIYQEAGHQVHHFKQLTALLQP